MGGGDGCEKPLCDSPPAVRAWRRHLLPPAPRQRQRHKNLRSGMADAAQTRTAVGTAEVHPCDCDVVVVDVASSAGRQRRPRSQADTPSSRSCECWLRPILFSPNPRAHGTAVVTVVVANGVGMPDPTLLRDTNVHASWHTHTRHPHVPAFVHHALCVCARCCACVRSCVSNETRVWSRRENTENAKFP